MATSFTSLPLVDLRVLQSDAPPPEELEALSQQLFTVFSTVGFAYLTNAPLALNEDAVFGIAREFFALPMDERMKLAKKTFRRDHVNTYRGYFPAQDGADNLKEGFEIGPATPVPSSSRSASKTFVLTEPNVFPPVSLFPKRAEAQNLYDGLQSLSARLLTLLAISLDKPSDTFTRLLQDSVSTLRLLHYPSTTTENNEPVDRLCCTPHTDSGLLTLLHQDPTGGLEVRNAAGTWIAAPYIPDTIVVNIGDLMAQMSGGRFVATEHRVRSSGGERYSVPFFCEPGVDAMVGRPENQVRYEEFVLGKMGTWIEFQDVDDPVSQNEEPLQSKALEMSVGA